ncbi:MAG: tetratricopeptide repeat protein [Proteobacteria bacterium]|nr:tetratricopeptide repeat protein [Pseudomonadota bacterium]
MRTPLWNVVCLVSAVGLAACSQTDGSSNKNPEKSAINVVDATNLNDIMLTIADPNEAVNYFSGALESDPERIDFQRGLASSLVRAKRATEALIVYKKILEHEDANSNDRIDYADALIRTNEWKTAAAELNKVPPTVETFKRYRLEAMIADSQKKWKKADSFYETAVELTTQPAGVLNNWGYSKLTRGDYSGAEELFLEAISYDPKSFTPKNNLVLARGSQGNYTLPLIKASQEERAYLLYTLGLTAVKKGETAVGRGLIEHAIETHPSHFDAAVRSLEALG